MLSKYYLLVGSFLLVLSVVSASDNTQTFSIAYHPFSTHGTLVENKSSVFNKHNYCFSGIYGIDLPQLENNPISWKLGGNWRQNIAPNEIIGAYLIADGLTHNSYQHTASINLGFEKSHYLLHHALNFYVPYATLHTSPAIDSMLFFKFAMDYKTSQRLSPSLWSAFGIYSVYNTESMLIGGIGIELKYIFFKKLQLQGKLNIDTTKQIAYDITIAYSNIDSYNPTHFSIHHRLRSLPLERHLAPFQYFMPLRHYALLSFDAQTDSVVHKYFGKSIRELQESPRSETQKQYRDICLRIHPDKTYGNPNAKQYEADFKTIQEAIVRYGILN